MENINHILTVENKNKVLITFVLEVLGFSDKEIKLKLKDICYIVNRYKDIY